jgi:serine/threonine-protein kinase
MSAPDVPNNPSLPLSVAERIDDACRRFERAWKAGQRPRLEDYLYQAEKPERQALLRELLILELHYRRRKGERPTAEEYHQHFPGQQDLIGALLGRDTDANNAAAGDIEAHAPARRDLLPHLDIAEMGEELGRGGMGIVYQRRCAVHGVYGGVVGGADFGARRREEKPMELTLSVIEGPHTGQAFTFTAHDTFLVGRSPRVHFRLRPSEKGEQKDRFVSRIHFMVEVNPPLCRLHDMNSRNGTFVNGKKVASADLSQGDVIKVGHTRLRVELQGADLEATVGWSGVFEVEPLTLPPPAPAAPAIRAGASSATCLSCSAPLGNAGPLCSACQGLCKQTPQAIPGYLLLRELGRGGMGIVYLALRRADDALVALKTIIPAVAAKPTQIQRFLREASILRELSHPNIVAFREMGTAGGQLFFAMDYVPGTDAARMLRHKGALEVRTAVRLVKQLLKALEYAHGKGFVHRDIKPANLLVQVTPEGNTVKVADFGLARVYQASQMSGLTLQHDLGGTVGYMAPEQITHYRDAEPPADQYSAAATLYNLLTGKHVYDLPQHIASQLSKILNEEPVPIRQRRADLPRQLARVIHRALARDPEDRYPDARAFRRALLPFTN